MAAFDPTTDTVLLLDSSAAAPARMMPGRFVGVVLTVDANINKTVTDSGVALALPSASNWSAAYGWGNHASAGYALASQIGAASGIAPLGSDGKIAATYLPSYVDDVVEGATTAAFPATGEAGKIYVALNTNKTYRWSGSVYAEISASPGSTDAVTEGASNLYYTDARVRAAVLTGLSPAAGTVAAADSVLAAFNKLQGSVASLTSSSLTAAGLAAAPLLTV